MDNQKHCESCGASLRKYSHRLTPILVKALIKFRTAVVKKNENKIHIESGKETQSSLAAGRNCLDLHINI